MLTGTQNHTDKLSLSLALYLSIALSLSLSLLLKQFNKLRSKECFRKKNETTKRLFRFNCKDVSTPLPCDVLC